MKKLTKTIAGIIAISVMFKTTVLVASTQMDSTNSKEIEQELFTEKQHPEAYCLALNIYYESRSDNLAGMAAVSDVVLNRVESTVYPNTVCDVIKQAKMKESWKTKQFPELHDSERKYIPIRNKCQFSWFCDGKADEPASGDSWNKAQTIAYRMLENDYLRGIAEGATHYHATYVDPKWNDDMLLVGRIGLHIFYVQR